ncbi:MAG TPA: hypothetical protein VFX70_15635 [Mycobacteriales bacterium]|nr:hypothetical protein [Mycobacteriales bacterium]
MTPLVGSPGATSRPRGAFRLTLPVGSYRIIEGICGVARRVDVRGGQTSSVTLRIPNAC